jgi:type IV secretory pathway VirB2 component (pilin)
MNVKYLNYFFVTALVAIGFFVGNAYAQPPAPPTLSNQICKIRQLFCGDTGLVLVATAVFTLGVLMFIGKVTWQTATIMAVAQ